MMEQNENARERPGEAAQDEILASILQKIGGTQNGGFVGTATAVSSGGANPIGDIFSSVLSNPELIAKLPSIISSIKPMLEMLSMGNSPSPSALSADTVGASTTVTKKERHSSDVGSDRRTALLCAMKPYLSEDRRNAVDYIVKLSRLGEILKTL